MMNEQHYKHLLYFSSPLKTLFNIQAGIMVIPLFIILVMNIIIDMILIFIKIKTIINEHHYKHPCVVFKIKTLFIIKATIKTTMLSSSFETKALFHTVTLHFITLNTNMTIIRKQS